MTTWQRTILGVIAGGLLAVGVIGWFTQDDQAGPGVLIRVGVVLGAIWLAAPGFDRVPRRVSVGLAVAIAIIGLRPRLVLGALAAGLLVMVLWKRR